jgi:N-acyl-D-aspartate/D-glutamate deacylase
MPDGARSIAFDTVIAGGLVFDGTGADPVVADVGIAGDVVAAIGPDLPRGPDTIVVDARGKWVTPGFVDLHTHYDAELLVDPSLSESVRHGVTTVTLGSCSLSFAVGTPEDLADMYCRVEGMPYDAVKKVLDEKKDWSTPREYLQRLDDLPLGPHATSFLGHSAIRVHVMGIERALTKEPPTNDELARMQAMVDDALDDGYLGLSVQTLHWDKMGGTRAFRSRPLPSKYASWRELRALTSRLRARGAVLQAVPNFSTKANIPLFLLHSAGLFFRKALKTTAISLGEPVNQRGVHRVAAALTRFVNRFLRADFKWQALPCPFDFWADGVEITPFEEFGAGSTLLHYLEQADRARLAKDPAFRARFKKEWKSPFLPGVFHKNLAHARVMAAPDATLVGKTFREIAVARGVDEVDLFLDLVALHGNDLRWFTVIANDRPREVERIMQHEDILVGFSDAGAHLRSLALYNFPLRLLKLARDAEREGRPFLSVAAAVRRLTSEIAEWLGFDAGVLAPGRRADVVVIDPVHLDERLAETHEEAMPGLDGFCRLVRRNDDAVPGVWISGRRAVVDGKPVAALGKERYGRVLRGTGWRNRATREATSLASTSSG